MSEVKTRRVMCELCDGTGLTLPNLDSDCTNCGGTAFTTEVIETQTNQHDIELKSGYIETDLQLAQALCDLEDCTDWEATFADSIFGQVERGNVLTERQHRVAYQILKKYD